MSGRRPANAPIAARDVSRSDGHVMTISGGIEPVADAIATRGGSSPYTCASPSTSFTRAWAPKCVARVS
jgi:hypothetical protein